MKKGMTISPRRRDQQQHEVLEFCLVSIGWSPMVVSVWQADARRGFGGVLERRAFATTVISPSFTDAAKRAATDTLVPSDPN